jgi:regulator of replication initiation timing
MNSAKKYDELAADVSEDPEIRRLNLFLDRLEGIEKELGQIITEIDQMRMEKEHALRQRKAGKRK